MAQTAAPDDAFAISRGMDLLGAAIADWPGLWRRLGDLETDWLADAIGKVEIEKPIYVCGLARSGSTILLELLASLDGVATHRYRDFPPVFTPYMWNWLLDRLPKKRSEPVERGHLDGLLVTPESPEAFEEVIWMAFFPQIHDPAVSNLLDARSANPAFERFYGEHLRKILLTRGGRRYLAKGNYNIARLGYIRKLFPDARFLIPVRDPVWHVASLIKQHRLFCEAERRNPRVLAYLRRVGHFEFGLDRRPINTGADQAVREIAALWRAGEEVRGSARYWSRIYGYLADTLDVDAKLAEAARVVRYEDLCEKPAETLRALLDHCDLTPSDDGLAALSGRIAAPSYYTPGFSPEELDIIAVETREVSARYGY